MAWYLNKALSTLRAEVDAYWPNRDKTSDGTIGDTAHMGTDSDHNPDPDGSVDAWDMDIDGVDVWHIIDRFERHEASRYWIYNRQIAKKSNGWRRETYTGSNPHDKHVHFNSEPAYENSTKPWGIGDLDMTKDEVFDAVWQRKASEYFTEPGQVDETTTYGDILFEAHAYAGKSEQAVKGVKDDVAAQAERLTKIEESQARIEAALGIEP